MINILSPVDWCSILEKSITPRNSIISHTYLHIRFTSIIRYRYLSINNKQNKKTLDFYQFTNVQYQ